MSFLLLFNGCQLRDPTKTHGINFLENRENELTLNVSNKNDVIKILGQPHIKSELDTNKWIYVERTKSKAGIHRLGKNILIANNLLELEFNDYGVLIQKKLYNKDDMNKITLNQNNTENDINRGSFIGGVLQSLREKMYSNTKK